jgi:hypothetical protein
MVVRATKPRVLSRITRKCEEHHGTERRAVHPHRGLAAIRGARLSALSQFILRDSPIALGVALQSNMGL